MHNLNSQKFDTTNFEQINHQEDREIKETSRLSCKLSALYALLYTYYTLQTK